MPSSDFWKELQLALPRKMQYRPVEGDPQTRLQDDKDPMLIVRGRAAQGRAMESELDPDPEGDLGMLIRPPCRSRGQAHSSLEDSGIQRSCLLRRFNLRWQWPSLPFTGEMVLLLGFCQGTFRVSGVTVAGG